MAEYMDSIETLFMEKIQHYNTLLNLLQQEARCIMEKDVDALWQFASEKKAAVTAIESTRKHILKKLGEASIAHGMNPRSFDTSRVLALLPSADSRELNRQHGRLKMLKRQINNLSRRNQQYVNQYLDIVKDLIGLMAGAGETGRSYGSRRPAYGHQGRGTNMLFNARV